MGEGICLWLVGPQPGPGCGIGCQQCEFDCIDHVVGFVLDDWVVGPSLGVCWVVDREAAAWLVLPELVLYHLGM